jgi:hypothetical protein
VSGRDVRGCVRGHLPLSSGPHLITMSWVWVQRGVVIWDSFSYWHHVYPSSTLVTDVPSPFPSPPVLFFPSQKRLEGVKIKGGVKLSVLYGMDSKSHTHPSHTQTLSREVWECDETRGLRVWITHSTITLSNLSSISILETRLTSPLVVYSSIKRELKRRPMIVGAINKTSLDCCLL